MQGQECVNKKELEKWHYGRIKKWNRATPSNRGRSEKGWKKIGRDKKKKERLEDVT